jgi:membrane-associated phospholipid phosphatase
MTPSTDSALAKLQGRRPWLVFLSAALVATVVAHLLDHAVWQHVRDLKVNDRDWGRLLRSMGYLPTWIVVAGALWLQDHGSPRRSADPSFGWGWRGGLMVLAPTVAGALGELLKMLIRRMRPSPDVFAYQWRPYSEDLLSTRNLGMPSSHVIVAFAAAAVLSRLFPRAWVLWYVLAVGCALARLLALGHFFSDTVVAALAGYAVGVVMARSGGFGRTLRSA